MSLKSSDPSGSRAPRGKPPIWSGGHQRPRFDVASFWRVTVSDSRDWLAPVVERLSVTMERGAHATACGAGAGTVARLGGAARLLPPRRAVVAGLRGTGLLMGVAAERIATVGRPEVVEPITLRGWPAEPAPAPARPVRPSRVAEADAAPVPAVPGDALLAVRGLIREAGALPPAAEPSLPTAGASVLPPLAPPEPPVAGPGLRLAGRATGLALLGLALPVGAVKALVAHFRGEDLKLREG